MKKTLIEQFQEALEQGYDGLGEIVFWSDEQGTYLLCHQKDRERCQSGEEQGLKEYYEESHARELALFTEQGQYRFIKGAPSLRSGWYFQFTKVESLYNVINQIYPASVALWIQDKAGHLRVQSLREKLSRQTGMYRKANLLSDQGCQQLVRQFCDPSTACLKKIKWTLDDSPSSSLMKASCAGGLSVPVGDDHRKRIPMLCQEPCNALVAQVAKAAKKEQLERLNTTHEH